jgi:hypothetical protein
MEVDTKSTNFPTSQELRDARRDLFEELRDTRREIFQGLRDLRRDQRTHFRVLFGTLIIMGLGLSFLLALGFHWL